MVTLLSARAAAAENCLPLPVLRVWHDTANAGKRARVLTWTCREQNGISLKVCTKSRNKIIFRSMMLFPVWNG